MVIDLMELGIDAARSAMHQAQITAELLLLEVVLLLSTVVELLFYCYLCIRPCSFCLYVLSCFCTGSDNLALLLMIYNTFNRNYVNHKIQWYL